MSKAPAKTRKSARRADKSLTARSAPAGLSIVVPVYNEAKGLPILHERIAEAARSLTSKYGLAVEGLMCIPPADENPGPYFALLEKLAGQAGVEKLSMGMSGDYETAVAFGATSVRVGSAIFGHR